MASELDFKALEEEFELEEKRNTDIALIERERNIESQGNIDEILRLNIERANFFLNAAEAEILNRSCKFANIRSMC